MHIAGTIAASSQHHRVDVAGRLVFQRARPPRKMPRLGAVLRDVSSCVICVAGVAAAQGLVAFASLDEQRDGPFAIYRNSVAFDENDAQFLASLGVACHSPCRRTRRRA